MSLYQPETFSLEEFQLQLVATLDHRRLLLQNVVDEGLEMWIAAHDGNLVVDGIKYTFVNDLFPPPDGAVILHA